MARRLPRSFYQRDPLEVAPELLNKVLVHGHRSARIVEVEAYRGTDDPASHAFRGPTPRTQTMFGAAGHLYVYFSYGMHWCANAVTSPPGTAGAVLLRAGEARGDLGAVRADRPAARRDLDLANGPAKLCQALGITGPDDGTDLTRPGDVQILDDGLSAPDEVLAGPRVGISVAVDRPWRFSIADDPHRSKPW